jgi:hypothetical protein
VGNEGLNWIELMKGVKASDVCVCVYADGYESWRSIRAANFFVKRKVNNC